MDKLLKVNPGIADKTFLYQKERLEEELKISDLDIDEDTFNNYIFLKLCEMEDDKMVENVEVFTTGSLSLHLFHLFLVSQRLKRIWTTILLTIGRSGWIQFSIH